MKYSDRSNIDAHPLNKNTYHKQKQRRSIIIACKNKNSEVMDVVNLLDNVNVNAASLS